MSQYAQETKKGAATRDRIVAAAEMLFAELGLEGASTRKIAGAAGVPPGLVSYYFNSKEGLYRAVFESRARAFLAQRSAGLQIARLEKNPDRRAELVVKALILPLFQMRASAGDANYGRLLVREVSDPRAHERGIVSEFFDTSAREVIDLLAGCYPDWNAAELHWAYQTLLGAANHIIADVGRIERLSDGAASASDAEAAATHVVAIVLAGFKYRDRTSTKTEQTNSKE